MAPLSLGKTFPFDIGRESGLRNFPPKLILAWVSEDPENRAWYIADIAPKGIVGGPHDQSLGRQLLISYGSSREVRSSLMSRHFGGAFSGSISAHYAAMLKTYEKMESIEDEPSVRRWISEMKDALSKEIKNARLFEERRGF